MFADGDDRQGAVEHQRRFLRAAYLGDGDVEPAQARRLGIVEPTWDEFYGENSLFEGGMAPFDDFFRSPDDDLDVYDNSMPILESLDYQGMGFNDNASWGYQGGYQPNSAYGGAQQQQGWGAAPAQQQQPPAQQQQQQTGDVFDLSAYEQQKGQGGF